MGAAASLSPRANPEEFQLALFSTIQREFKVINKEDLPDELVFERMKHVGDDLFPSLNTQWTVALTSWFPLVS